MTARLLCQIGIFSRKQEWLYSVREWHHCLSQEEGFDVAHPFNPHSPAMIPTLAVTTTRL